MNNDTPERFQPDDATSFPPQADPECLGQMLRGEGGGPWSPQQREDRAQVILRAWMARPTHE